MTANPYIYRLAIPQHSPLCVCNRLSYWPRHYSLFCSPTQQQQPIGSIFTTIHVLHPNCHFQDFYDDSLSSCFCWVPLFSRLLPRNASFFPKIMSGTLFPVSYVVSSMMTHIVGVSMPLVAHCWNLLIGTIGLSSAQSLDRRIEGKRGQEGYFRTPFCLFCHSACSSALFLLLFCVNCTCSLLSPVSLLLNMSPLPSFCMTILLHPCFRAASPYPFFSLHPRSHSVFLILS